MNPLETINHFYSVDHELSLEGSQIGIENGYNISEKLIDPIIDNKIEILEMLNRDRKAKKAGLMVGIPGTIYLWTVSRFSNAYMAYWNGEWIAWRESYKDGKPESISHKLIARGNTFDYVLVEFKKYIDYVSRKRG